MPKFYDIKDIRGNRVPLSKKADAIAEYLFEKQCGPTSPSPPPENARENVFSHPLPFFTGNLSANEVRNAISKLKTNKTPGPDGAITELFKWLDDHTLEQLTDCLNVFWTENKFLIPLPKHKYAVYTKKVRTTILKTIVPSRS